MSKWLETFKLIFITALVLLFTGCATLKPETTIVHQTKVVVVKTSPELLFTYPVEPPPTKDQFLPFTPATERDRLELLYIQRGLLFDYSRKLTEQVGIYKAQIEKIREEQNLATQRLEGDK